MNNFEHNLLTILDEIKNHEVTDKNIVLKEMVKVRLEESINRYYKDLMSSYKYLLNTNKDLRINKLLNRLEENNEFKQ